MDILDEHMDKGRISRALAEKARRMGRYNARGVMRPRAEQDAILAKKQADHDAEVKRGEESRKPRAERRYGAGK